MSRGLRFFLFFVSFSFIGIIFLLSLFVLVYDLNPFRSSIENHLRKHFDVQAKIGYLSIRWEDYLGLSIDGLILRRVDDGRLLLTSKKIDMTLDLKELLKRRIVIRALDVQSPEIQIQRHGQGVEWNWPQSFMLNLISGFVELPDEVKNDFSAPRKKWQIQAKEIIIREATLCIEDSVLFDALGRMCVEPLNLKATAESSGVGFYVDAQWKLEPLDPSFFWLNAEFDSMTKILSFEITYGDKLLELKGAASYPFQSSAVSGILDIHQLDLSKLPGSRFSSNNSLTGVLTGHADWNTLWTWGELPWKDLKYQGTGDLRSGEWLPVNLARKALDRTNLIPELIAPRIASLSESNASALASQGTVFERLEFSFQGTSEKTIFNEVNLTFSDYLIKAEGEVLHSHPLSYNSDMKVIFLEDISAEILLKFPEWAAYRNRHGRLIFPLSWSNFSEETT